MRGRAVTSRAACAWWVAAGFMAVARIPPKLEPLILPEPPAPPAWVPAEPFAPESPDYPREPEDEEMV
jgi:hypothetical protein